jgi:hypothetical protein
MFSVIRVLCGGCLRLELDFATLCFFKRLDDGPSHKKKVSVKFGQPWGVFFYMVFW